MAVDSGFPLTPTPSRVAWGWLRTLVFGFILFIITTIVMFATGNPNLYPTVILIGNFLIPVVFVTFLYDHQHLSMLPSGTIAQSFTIGGVLGVLGASILEPLLIAQPTNSDQSLTLSSALLIGLIEEGSKIVAVMIMARRLRRNNEIDGLLLGAAIGMGFAALESTGYAFTAFLESQGVVGASIAATVVRGALSPFGHGVWTAILSAVLFRQASPNRFHLSGSVVLTYLFVALLHGLWDGIPRIIYVGLSPNIRVSLVSLLISLAGLAVLAGLWRQAIHRKTLSAEVETPSLV